MHVGGVNKDNMATTLLGSLIVIKDDVAVQDQLSVTVTV
jgi:hypothetical protein